MPEQGSAEHPARTGVEFSTAMRGYDKEEVDTFVRELADEHTRLLAQLATAQRSAEKAHLELGEEMGELLQHAKDIADGLVKKAGEEASVTMENARSRAQGTIAEARRRAEDLTRQAEAAAIASVREAQQKVAALQELESEVRSRLAVLQRTAQGLDGDIERVTQQDPVEQRILDDTAEIARLNPTSG